MIGEPSISARKVCFICREAIETVLLFRSDYLYIKMRATSFAILMDATKANRCYDFGNG